MKKRFFAAMLAAAVMALFLLPQASFAAGESGIQLGTGGLKKDDEVYFGESYTNHYTFDAPWIVLDANGFLFSKHVLGAYMFNDSNDVYSGSVLHGAMSTYYNNMFTPAEKAAIKDTTLTGASMDPTASDLTGQKLFPLSIDEIAAIGWGSDILKAPYNTLPNGLIVPWWSRTTDIGHGLVFHIDTNGYSVATTITQQYSNGHRPALNLDLGAVLFMSPAVDGKASGAVGPAALNANLSPSSSSKNTWKLTLLDNKAGSGRESFAVSTQSVSVGTAGGDVSVAYAAAKTGANEYLSALLVDSANNVLYYGRLKSLAGGGSSGTQDITIPALPAGSYTLKIFNEQCNGDYKTDYASAFRDVALVVSDRPPPSPVPTAEPSIPQTGDTALPGLWIGLALLAGVTLTTSLMLRGKKRG